MAGRPRGARRSPYSPWPLKPVQTAALMSPGGPGPARIVARTNGLGGPTRRMRTALDCRPPGSSTMGSSCAASLGGRGEGENGRWAWGCGGGWPSPFWWPWCWATSCERSDAIDVPQKTQFPWVLAIDTIPLPHAGMRHAPFSPGLGGQDAKSLRPGGWRLEFWARPGVSLGGRMGTGRLMTGIPHEQDTGWGRSAGRHETTRDETVRDMTKRRP